MIEQNLAKIRHIKDSLDHREQGFLRPFACFSTSAVRRHHEPRQDTEFRQSFSVDADRILHSLGFTRYPDKTQVFSLIRNDHLTYRGLHVQMVSKIARTIGRALGLNQDLIEAAALGHDIGHPPFGHDGEHFLSGLTQEAGIGRFCHNLQSIQFLDRIERKGRGWNLTLQTLDAIMCHNGEAAANRLAPDAAWAFSGGSGSDSGSDQEQADIQQAFTRLDIRIRNCQADPALDLVPMTLEGCAVRMADSIAYIGRDLEDAIRLGVVAREQIPKDAEKMLGKTNGTIVFSLVTDLIANSLGKPFLAFSPETAQALESLKRFNYKAIYTNPAIKRHLTGIKDIFRYFFDTYLTDLANDNRESIVFTEFLKDMDDSYVQSHSHAEMVRDFIAGMTDTYFVNHAPKSLAPQWIDDLNR